MQTKSFLTYARTVGPEVRMSQAKQIFARVPLAKRRGAMETLFQEGNRFARQLVQHGDDSVLADFSQAERVRLWQDILLNADLIQQGNDHAIYFCRRFFPTPTKAADFLEAVLTADSLKAHKVEYLAHLMSCLRWDEIPTHLKEHEIFKALVADELQQGVISLISNRNGEMSNIGDTYICSRAERYFVTSQAKQLVLVNNNIVFKRNHGRLDLAVCIRDFVSASGYVFFAGMFYLVVGEQNRLAINSHPREAMIQESIFWQPTRALNQTRIEFPAPSSY